MARATRLALFTTCLLIACVSLAARSAADTSGPNAVFVKQSVPSTWTAGNAMFVVLTFKNTGDTTWDPVHVGVVCAQGSACPWTPRAVGLQGKLKVSDSVQEVKPGESYTRLFPVTTPTKPGTYALSWSMSFDGKPFGQPSALVNVSIIKAP